MPQPNWKIISSSVTGTSHAVSRTSCQDYHAWRIVGFREEILIAVVSDGAGSAKKGDVGAKLTCQFLVSEILAFAEKEYWIKNITHKKVTEWFKSLQAKIEVEAKTEGVEKQDFACTLLAVVIQADSAIFMQLGDGAIVYSTDENKDEFDLFTLPQQGEYANSTYFVTDEKAIDFLKFQLIEKNVAEVAIFTDGLQRIALDFIQNKPHAPFFKPMFAPLRNIKANDPDVYLMLKSLQNNLNEFLDSPKINERTDDDKTLILASRRTAV